MKKKYQKPEMRAIEITTEQFIATSGPGFGDGNGNDELGKDGAPNDWD